MRKKSHVGKERKYMCLVGHGRKRKRMVSKAICAERQNCKKMHHVTPKGVLRLAMCNASATRESP